MAPIALSSTTTESPSPATLKLNLRSAPQESAPVDPGLNRLSGPLPYTGSLDSYPHFEVTPSIGREFGKELQLTDLLKAENSDELIRDLAVLSESLAWSRCCKARGCGGKVGLRECHRAKGFRRQQG